MSVAPMSVGRREKPILGHVPKNAEKKLVHKRLRQLNNTTILSFPVYTS